MSESISFTVLGLPTPKGSFTPTRNGGFRPQGDSAKLKAWRNHVTTAARDAMGSRKPFQGAIRLSVDFSLPYPRTSIRQWQWGWWPAVKRPDVDKLLRSINDHLNGLAWYDDSQVCFCTVNKHYAWDDLPGAYVEVAEMDDEWLRQYAATRTLIQETLREMADE